MRSRWPWPGVLGMLLAAGCLPPEPPVPIPPVSAGKVRVRVFAEPTPVRTVDAVGKVVFVATDDAIERWDGGGGVAIRGAPGEHVLAIAGDADRKRLWILSDGGLGTYDAGTGMYTAVAALPADLDVDRSAALAPASDGGAWLGTARGLDHVGASGEWQATPIRDPVRAMLADRAGWLWVATRAGLIARKPGGEVVHVAAAEGCEVVDPRLVVVAPGDRVLVIGGDDQGHERIAVGRELAWTTYRALPGVIWDAATGREGGVVLMGGGRVYRMTPRAGAVRLLARDGIRLLTVAGADLVAWSLDPIDVVVPPGATALASAEDQLLIGTRDLGTARYRDGEPQPHGWLRRKEMFADATTLSVACARADDCWIATGARQAWHWNGERFVAGGPDEVVLAVARDPAGRIYAVHRAADDHEAHLSRIEGTTWTAVPKVVLATPGDAPEISFARFGAGGALWLGLRYRDGAERRAWGIAIVEPASGRVSYRHAEDAHDPIPIGVIDGDVRGDVAWLATSEGVARLGRGRVQLWSSELARAITITPGGEVFAATDAGVSVWNGKTWEVPAALQFEVNDVVATRTGQVWMASERGIAAWDGKNLRRVDTRRGLAENQVLDIAVDHLGRVWARGPGSLTLISQ